VEAEAEEDELDPSGWRPGLSRPPGRLGRTLAPAAINQFSRPVIRRRTINWLSVNAIQSHADDNCQNDYIQLFGLYAAA